MRLHRGVPMLAAVLTLAGTSAPAANAFVGVSAGGPSGQPTRVTQHPSGDNADWAIAIAAAGGLTLAGAGFAARRSAASKSASARRSRRRPDLARPKPGHLRAQHRRVLWAVASSPTVTEHELRAAPIVTHAKRSSARLALTREARLGA